MQAERDPREPLLRMVGITKRFPGVVALERANLDVHAGEVVALVGENGAGKSTLLEILNPHPAPTGFFVQDEGEIVFRGHPVRPKSPAEAQRLGIAVIHQTPSLIPTLTVAENIFLGREPRTRLGLLDHRHMDVEAEALLVSIRAAVRPGDPVAQLGAAQQQMVELAKALALEARLIVMDELTSALSPHEVGRIFQVIRDLRARGLGIVFVSHRLEEVFAIADRIVVLRDGRVVGAGAAGDLSMEQVVRWMVGREVEAVAHGGADVGPPVLEVRRLRGPGLQEATLRVHRGEIVGLTGLVGAGRTQLADCLFGFRQASEGEVLIDGRTVVIRGPRDAIAAHMGYVPEDRHRRGLVLSMTVTENLTLPQLSRFQSWAGLDTAGEARLADRFIERLRIATPHRSQRVLALSGGNQQKVLLARWLALEPRILIVDEPTKGVDVGAKSEIHRLMRQLAAQGMAILMISSELPEVLRLSDRVVVMSEGRVVAEWPVADATPERIMLAAAGAAGSPFR